eukprot:Selendium_serpulae@DN6217_c3_g1_i6.p1
MNAAGDTCLSTSPSSSTSSSTSPSSTSSTTSLSGSSSSTSSGGSPLPTTPLPTTPLPTTPLPRVGALKLDSDLQLAAASNYSRNLQSAAAFNLHGYGTTQFAGSNTAPVFVNEVLINADCSSDGSTGNTGIEVVGIGGHTGDATIIFGNAAGEQGTATVSFTGAADPEIVYKAIAEFSDISAGIDLADGFAMVLAAVDPQVVYSSVAWGNLKGPVAVTAPAFTAYPLNPLGAPAVRLELTGEFTEKSGAVWQERTDHGCSPGLMNDGEMIEPPVASGAHKRGVRLFMLLCGVSYAVLF